MDYRKERKTLFSKIKEKRGGNSGKGARAVNSVLSSFHRKKNLWKKREEGRKGGENGQGQGKGLARRKCWPIRVPMQWGDKA